MKLFALILTLCFAGALASSQALEADKIDFTKMTENATLTNEEVVALINKVRLFLAQNEEFQKMVPPELKAQIDITLKQLETHSDAGKIVGGVILVIAEIIVDAYELALVYKKCEAMEDPTQQGFCFTRFAIKILTSINDIRLTIQSIINSVNKSLTATRDIDLQKPMPFSKQFLY